MVQEVGQHAAFCKSNLIVSISKVVQYGVDASNDTARIVEDAGLLHVELVCDSKITSLTIFLLFQELSVDNHSDAGLGNEAKEVLLEAIDLAEGPLGWHA